VVRHTAALARTRTASGTCRPRLLASGLLASFQVNLEDKMTDLTHRRVRVSVCAARDDEDVRAVVAGGADAVGVLVQTRHVAEDAVDLAVASKVLDTAPPYVGRYAVTHAVDLSELVDCIDALPIDALQLHDRVDPAVVARLRAKRPWVRLLKAIHVTDGVPEITPWDDLCDALIFDSVDPKSDRIGGTGKTHNWGLTARAATASKLPVVLAGGLTVDNVGHAVEVVRPWAVNVNSGVERSGRKSADLVRALVGTANRAQG
jgi:phosphoribosylanthranilate isomerase